MSGVKPTSAKVTEGHRLADIPETIKCHDTISEILRPGVQRALKYSHDWGTSEKFAHKSKAPTGFSPDAASYVASRKHTPHKKPVLEITRDSGTGIDNLVPRSDAAAAVLVASKKLAKHHKKPTPSATRGVALLSEPAFYVVSKEPTILPKYEAKTDPKAEKELGLLIAGFIANRSHRSHVIQHHGPKARHVHVEVSEVERIGDLPLEQPAPKVASR